MYICSNCWYQSIAKLWKCPECWSFWTFSKIENKNSSSKKINILTWNKNIETKFYDLDNKEIKRVFTKWIKSSWFYLLWWQPWIWKSTIALQILKAVKEKVNIWYFSWEEESSAILERYERLFWEKAYFEIYFEIYHGTVLEDIIETIKYKKLDIFVIDSIQTIYSNQTTWIAWSVNQVKYCSEKLSEFLKKFNKACILIWHITKSWEIAWPKYLEHIVDVVAYLEWDRLNEYRFLRTQKNRFWWTDDIAIFQMKENWLIPVSNLKEIINSNISDTPWNVLTVWIDNGRPVITNIEVLLNKTKYKFPKRSTIWVDNSRIEMIIAVLERYLKLDLWFMDIFINIPWEFEFYDSWIDLAIAVWILSAYKNKKINHKNIFIWEVSLSWRINKTKFHDKRIREVQSMNVFDFQNIKNIYTIKDFI